MIIFLRSAKVILQCGTVEKILTVEEPSTCVYMFTFSTPLACTDAILDDAKVKASYWLESH